MERGGKLSKAPVVYSLVHVRFSPILSMANHVPAIQEKLRGQYPRYTVGQIQQIRIGAEGTPEVGSSEQQWDFSTKDNDAGIRMGTGTFIYHCTRYTTFDGFLSSAIEALAVIHEMAHITLVERIGLRYVDLVVPDDGKDITDYLISPLTGFRNLDAKENEFIIALNQTNLKTKFGVLTVRSVVGTHITALPPDLAVCNLSVLRQPPQDKQTALVDTDHASDVSFDFSVDDVAKRIDELHQPISKAFWSAITPFAAQAWK